VVIDKTLTLVGEDMGVKSVVLNGKIYQLSR